MAHTVNYALESAELPVGDGFAVYDNAMRKKSS